MSNKTRLVKDVDDHTWRHFAGYCKVKDVKVGIELTEILNSYLKLRVATLDCKACGNKSIILVGNRCSNCRSKNIQIKKEV